MSEILAAVLGALIVWLTTYFTEHRKAAATKSRDAAFLGVVVLIHLDKFISECATVASDDGTVLGQASGRDENGEDYYAPQTHTPTLEIEELKVEWRSIPPQLMYAVYSLPLKIRDALEYLDHVSDGGWPDGTEYMAARQERFAQIGVAAADIAQELRVETGIPAVIERKWSAEKHLRERNEFYKAQAESQEAAHNEMLASLKREQISGPN